MQRLIGKVALVTGAGRRGGLGAAIATRLAAEGAAVIVTDVAGGGRDLPADRVGSQSELEVIAAEICAQGGRAISQPLDVRDEAMVIAAVECAAKEFGGLDILINNAGIGFMMEPLVEMPIERWRTVLDVNLAGAFLCTQHAARQMIKQGRGGRVINIASVA